VVIHEAYYFELPDHALPLPSLVEEHENANPDSDKRVVRNHDVEISHMLFEPHISHAS